MELQGGFEIVCAGTRALNARILKAYIREWNAQGGLTDIVRDVNSEVLSWDKPRVVSSLSVPGDWWERPHEFPDVSEHVATLYRTIEPDSPPRLMVIDLLGIETLCATDAMPVLQEIAELGEASRIRVVVAVTNIFAIPEPLRRLATRVENGIGFEEPSTSAKPGRWLLFWRR